MMLHPSAYSQTAAHPVLVWWEALYRGMLTYLSVLVGHPIVRTGTAPRLLALFLTLCKTWRTSQWQPIRGAHQPPLVARMSYQETVPQ